MKTAIKRTLNTQFGPKWYQVIRVDPLNETTDIVCEHRTFWVAQLCAWRRPRRGLVWFDFQCRSCKNCHS